MTWRVAWARWCFVARSRRVPGFKTRARAVGNYWEVFRAFTILETARREAEHD